MSFLNNLAKGFVRSAVNQVGRDGGKVISNNIYSRAHSSPISVQIGNYQSTDGLVEKREYIVSRWFYAIIFSFIIPILGGLIVVFMGYININKNYMMMSKIENVPIYKSDKRFTTGRKYMGYQEVKKDIKVDITGDRIINNKIKAIGYFAIGFVAFIYYIIRFFIK